MKNKIVKYGHTVIHVFGEPDLDNLPEWKQKAIAKMIQSRNRELEKDIRALLSAKDITKKSEQ